MCKSAQVSFCLCEQEDAYFSISISVSLNMLIVPKCDSISVCQHINVHVFISVCVSCLCVPAYDLGSLCIWGYVCVNMIYVHLCFVCVFM